MTRLRCNSFLLLLVLIFGISSSRNAQASPGVPGSPEYGFGAILYPDGTQLEEALAMAVDLGLDWVEVPIEWRILQPTPGPLPPQPEYDFLFRGLDQREIAVMISISGAPDWALNRDGPDPVKTAEFVSALLEHYGGWIDAVELFPGANTRRAWQGEVSPQAYLQLFDAVRLRLEQASLPVLLVAGGLQPLSEIPPKGDWQDIFFLQKLYDLGAAERMPVISMQYIEITGDPLLFSTTQEARVLRRYEEVRSVMVENHHQTGMIWITHFHAPSGKINTQDSEYSSESGQIIWLSRAYSIMRSQLYIGTAFLPSLNSRGEGTAAEVSGLLQRDGTFHPFYSVLRELIGLSQMDGLADGPGKAKEGNFVKKRPWL